MFREFKSSAASSEITRRTFCGQVAMTSLNLALAGSGFSQPQHPPVAYPPVKINGAERLLPGAFLYFVYPTARDPAVLVRARDGEYLAYSRKCAHLGCSVEADAARGCLKCPCHLGAYDSRTGYVIYGPPPRPLDQIILQMRAGGEVWAVGKRFGSSQNNA